MYKSLHSFESTSLNYSDPRILSFSADQTLYEIKPLNDKWKFVRNKNGDVGLAPCDYLKICESSSKKQSLFIVDQEFQGMADHELNFKQGEQIEVIQGNSELPVWLVQKMDGRRALIPSFHIKTSIPSPHVPPRNTTNRMTPSPEENSQSPPPLPIRSVFLGTDTDPEPCSSQGSIASAPMAAPRGKPAAEESGHSPLERRHSLSHDLGSFELVHISHVPGCDVYTQTPLSPRSEFSTDPQPHAAIDTDTAAQLLDYVREHAQVSFDSARLSVDAVLRFLGGSAALSPLTEQLALLQAEVDKSLQLKESLVETEDERIICDLSQLFQERVLDYQERSWEVLSDQHAVGEQVDTLIRIFQEADPRAVRRAVSSDDCQLLSTLSAFYCGERRPAIRLKLITALKLLSALHSHYSSRLLATTLASSLPNDLLNVPSNFRLALETARLAVYLFSSGDQIPVDLYDAWTPGLFQSLLALVEERFVVDVDECLPKALMTLLFSFNLHIQSNVFPYWTFSEMASYRTFIDMLMLYLNRDVDPVPVLEHPRAHSVLKMALDLTSHSLTRDLLDGSDMRILVDIGIRNVLDLSPLHPQVPIYLKLLLILRKEVGTVREYRSLELVNICETFKDSSIDNTIIHQLILDLYNLLID